MNNGEVIYRRDFLKIALGAGAAALGIKIFEKNINSFLNNLNDVKPEPLPISTPPPAKKEKPVRNDVKVILGTSRDDLYSSVTYVAKYLNKSQEVPNENIVIIPPDEFTYKRFLETVNKVGANASDSDTLIMDIINDAGVGVFSFSKEGIKYDRFDGSTQDYYTYREIAEAIKNNTNPNTRKLVTIGGCYDGSAIPAVEEIAIPNAAVITKTTEKAIATGGSALNILITEHDVFPRIDYNGDGKISIKESYQSWKKRKEDGPELNLSVTDTPNAKSEGKIIPQIWDPNNITDEIYLIG